MATDRPVVKVYLLPEQAERLRAICNAEERTITGLVRLAITAWLEQRDKTAAA